MSARPETPPGAAPAPTFRALLALAWPIVVSRSSQVVVGLSDAVMVAHLGAGALAAVTAGAMNALMLFILPIGTVFIVQSFSAQLFGRGDLAGARRYGWYGLAVAAATLLLGLGAFAVPGALALLDYEPPVRAQMAGYLAWRLWAGAPAVGLEALAAYYGGLGDTRLPMRANVAAMALNVAGNWLLIDGRLGLPALGAAGAGAASLAATALAFLGLLAVFLRDGRRAGAPIPPLRWGELGRTLRFGIPSGLNWFLEFLAFGVFVNVIVAGLGTTPLAALMVVMQVNAIAFMPSFALASAGAILAGQSIGAGAKDQVPRVVGVTFAAAGGWQGLAGLAYVLVPGLLLAAFARDPVSAGPLLETGRRMLMLSAAWQLFDAAAATLSEALRAAGDTAFTLWARLAIAWAVFVPGSWLAVNRLGLGETGAVLSLVLYLALLAGALWLRFRSGAWRRLELVEPAAG